MPSLKLQLMTITPLLMNGDQKTPEIRPPSFRGNFRYWTRSLLGNEVGDDTDKLAERESAIWGSTQAGSAVRVRVFASDNLTISRGVKVLPLSSSFFTGFDPDQQFSVELSTHPLSSNFPPEALGGVLLALRFGGFGQRARRGGGNLAVLKAEIDMDDDVMQSIAKMFQRKPRDRAKLQSYLKQDINLAMSAVETGKKHLFLDTIPSYPVFHPEHVKVLVGVGYERYEQALSQMSQPRSQQPFKDDRLFGTVRGGRRASPVHMGIHRTGDGFHPVMTIFRSKPERSSKWEVMQDFVDLCKSSYDFEEIYGEGKWNT